ncbi:MAG: hypothetical protein IT267_10230 [Saprospiraceae bacterium]|nr:hypothetical protein [Saprospiraceae bacterium]
MNKILSVFSNKHFLISVLLVSLIFTNFSCNRGTGCPGEEAKVKLDRKGNPKSKPSSGIFDSKGRMNSKGYRNDHRKPKKSKNYKN